MKYEGKKTLVENSSVTKRAGKKYILFSSLECGFWNIKRGWVSKSTSATKFSGKERTNVSHLLPTGAFDAEWQVFSYEW